MAKNGTVPTIMMVRSIPPRQPSLTVSATEKTGRERLRKFGLVCFLTDDGSLSFEVCSGPPLIGLNFEERKKTRSLIFSFDPPLEVEGATGEKVTVKYVRVPVWRAS